MPPPPTPTVDNPVRVSMDYFIVQPGELVALYVNTFPEYSDLTIRCEPAGLVVDSDVERKAQAYWVLLTIGETNKGTCTFSLLSEGVPASATIQFS